MEWMGGFAGRFPMAGGASELEEADARDRDGRDPTWRPGEEGEASGAWRGDRTCVGERWCGMTGGERESDVTR